MFKQKALTAAEIAEAIDEAKAPAQFDSLYRQCDERRVVIAARLREIDTVGYESPARVAAIKKGPEALRALEKEADDLTFELSYLDRLQALIVAGMEEARRNELRKAIPPAVSRLPDAIAAVQKAADALDRAIADFDAAMAPVLSYSDAGVPYPLKDQLVQAALQVRERLWTRRTITLPLPPLPADDEAMREAVQKLPLAYAWHGIGSFTFTTRTGPHQHPGQSGNIHGV